ncbi:MAG TPA: Rid family detoxifying hydrolase [Steroidobacteraceae bacterium]|nr:Rid family detoxifying hydrolase [Steroidobacteraceae bacterium]
MPRQATNSSHLATSIGPFSHAVRAGELVFLSGQVAQDPATGQLIKGSVRLQTQQIFANIAVLLKDLGLTLAAVVKVNVFLTAMSNFAEMNAVYGEHFGQPYPARTTVAVSELPLRALVEMEMVASKA